MSYNQNQHDIEIFQDFDAFSQATFDVDYYPQELSPPLSSNSKKINKTLQKKQQSAKTIETGRKQKKFWQPHEDAQVLELIAKIGFKWTKIGTIIGGRTGKQVRDRYNNALNSTINQGKWTLEEDQLLISLYNKLGNKWCRIAEQIPGRTENQVKNRFHTRVKDSTSSEGSTSNEAQAVSPYEESTPSSGLSPIIYAQEFDDTFQSDYEFEPRLIKIVSQENIHLDLAGESFYEREACNIPKKRERSSFENLVESILRGYPNLP